MKKFVVAVFILSAGLASCFSTEADVHHVKDLDENMIDLRAYHENLGESLRKKDKDYAEWLSHDMDSVLQLMAERFSEHRKLNEPFSKHYQTRIQPYMKDLITAIDKNDWPIAVKAYATLTRKCNGCHVDHDINKEVIDLSK
jgi:hypothetical protein